MDFKLRIALGIIVVLIIAGIFGYYRMNSELNRVISENGTLERDVEYWKDEEGKSNAKTQAAELTLRELKNSNNADIKALREDIGKLKNFVSRLTVQTRTSGTINTIVKDTTIVVNGDTAKVKDFEYEDEWVMLNGRLFPKLDSVTIDYSFSENLTIDHKWEREKGIKNWFKPKQLKIQAKVDNPHSEIFGIREIKIIPEPKKFYQTRGFQLGAAFVAGTIIGGR